MFRQKRDGAIKVRVPAGGDADSGSSSWGPRATSAAPWVRARRTRGEVEEIVGVGPPAAPGVVGGEDVSWNGRGNRPGSVVVRGRRRRRRPPGVEDPAPARRGEMLATNVDGTRRVLDAVARRGAGSSPPHRSAPTPPARRTVSSTSRGRSPASRPALLPAQGRGRADARRCEAANPTATVRMRTSLVFQRAAASEIHASSSAPGPRAAAGAAALRARGRPVVFRPPTPTTWLRRTAPSSASRRGVQHRRRPTADPGLIADMTGARTSRRRPACCARQRPRLSGSAPTSEPGWLDLAVQTPLMATTRAPDALGWRSPTLPSPNFAGRSRTGATGGATIPGRCMLVAILARSTERRGRRVGILGVGLFRSDTAIVLSMSFAHLRFPGVWATPSSGTTEG